MDRSYYLNLNQQFQDTRLSSLHKLERIQEYLSLIDEYKNRNPTSNLSELNLSFNIEAAKKFLSLYLDCFGDPKKKRVFIGCNDGGKIISSENGEVRMRCDHGVPLEWEKFTIEDIGNGKVALKSMNKYVSSEWGLSSMACNRRKIGYKEVFKMIDHGNSIFSFKGCNGRYISSKNDGKLICCGFKKSKSVKLFVRRIQSLGDEIEIGWKFLNKHTNALCDKCDTAEKERAKIDPENFYFMKSIEVRHSVEGKVYTTRHEEKHFDKRGYKAAVKIADKKVIPHYFALHKHTEYIKLLLKNENKKLEEITKMFNLCTAAIPQLQNICEQMNATSTNNDENDYTSLC